MAELPLRVQDKIESYISILAPRYPPNIPSWKISVGYANFRDAESDTTPVTTIYTLKNSQPKLGDNIFSDSSKKVLYNGASLWFNLFSSSDAILSVIIQITNKGQVIDLIDK
jgi:hypothetical protein